jgi:hypothetical protein
VAEVLGRFVDAEENRQPAAMAWKLYYTATDAMTYGMSVCNGEGADAHLWIWIVPVTHTWADGEEPPYYSVIHKKQRVEADGIDGNTWVMPVTVLNEGDRVVVLTDVYGVTFLGHGIKFTDAPPAPEA